MVEMHPGQPHPRRTAIRWGSQPLLSRVRLMTTLLRKEIVAVLADKRDDDTPTVRDRHERTRVRYCQAKENDGLLKTVLRPVESSVAQAAQDRAAMERAVKACNEVGSLTDYKFISDAEEELARRVRQKRF